MTSERDHSHATSTATPAADHDDLVPGRGSRSALLRKPDHAIISGLVQRRARDANGVADGAEHAVTAASSSSGAPLPEALLRKFESSLGTDLSGVRVHTGEASAAANDAVGAKAYTVGQDIHFGAGQFDPSSSTGEHLLAHEVAHTVQQGSGAQRMQFKLAVSSPGDALEHEADRAADAMVAGAPASVSGASELSRVVQRESLLPPLLGLGYKLGPQQQPKQPLPPLTEDDKKQIGELKKQFDDAETLLIGLVGDFSDNQVLGIQQLKEEIEKQPKISTEQAAVKSIVEGLVGALLGKVGGYVAGKAVAMMADDGPLIGPAIEKAFAAGAAAAQQAAGAAATSSFDALDGAKPFFFGAMKAIPSQNGAKRKAIQSEANAYWSSAEKSVEGAKRAVASLTALYNAGQANLDANKPSADATKAAMDRWLVLVARSEMGEHYDKKTGVMDGTDMYKPKPGKIGRGILELEIIVPWDDVAKKALPARFSSRTIKGLSDDAAKLAYAGRPIREMEIPKIIRGREERYYQGEGYKWHTRFAIKVNEQNVIWMAENAEASLWLQARGGNKDPAGNYNEATAHAGTSALLAELASWVLF